MWKKTENEPHDRPTAEAPKPPTSRSGTSGGAVIGKSIVIDGDLSGSEDMTIHGRVKGQVKLPNHTLQIGPEGRLEARASARSIRVEGRVEGDLTADQEIVIRQSGDVRGNLTAPRIGLEEGARFRGSIEMEPGRSTSTQADQAGASKSSDRVGAQGPKQKPDAASASENKATG